MRPDPSELNSLWGCTLTSHSWDLVQHTLLLVVDCLDAGRTTRTALTLNGVFSLRFESGANASFAPAYMNEPWSYIELTSIEAKLIDVGGRSAWHVTAELWSLSRIEVLCADWQVKSDTTLSAPD